MWGSQPDLSDEYLLGANPTEVEHGIQNFLNGGYETYMENDPSIDAGEYEDEGHNHAMNLASRNHLWTQGEHESARAGQEANWVNIFPTGESKITIPINLRRNPLWEKGEHESALTRQAQWEQNQGRRVEQVWTEGPPTDNTH